MGRAIPPVFPNLSQSLKLSALSGPGVEGPKNDLFPNSPSSHGGRAKSYLLARCLVFPSLLEWANDRHVRSALGNSWQGQTQPSDLSALPTPIRYTQHWHVRILSRCTETHHTQHPPWVCARPDECYCTSVVSQIIRTMPTRLLRLGVVAIASL